MIRECILFGVLASWLVVFPLCAAESISSTTTFDYGNMRVDPGTPLFLSNMFPLGNGNFGFIGSNGNVGVGCEYFEITRGSYEVSGRKILSPNESQCQASTRTMNGDIVIAGTTSYSGDDAIVQRFDSNRDLIWDYPFDFQEDDFPTGVIELSDGSIIVAEGKILKLDADGNRLWRRFFSPAQYYRERGGGIVEVEELNIISSVNSSGDIFVHKISKSGILLWRKKLTTAESQCHQSPTTAPVCGADGNYFVGCSRSSRYTIYKLSKDGQVLWKRTIIGTGSTSLYSMLADEDGGVVLGASHVIKLDADGHIEWELSSQSYSGRIRRTPYGYGIYTGDGVREIVPDITPSDAYVPSGSIVGLKSSATGLLLSNDYTSKQVYADSDVARFATQWVMVRESKSGSFFLLRSTVNGKVATLIKEGTEVVLKASTLYKAKSRNTRLKFRLKHLSAGEVAIQSARQSFGYLRPEKRSKRGKIIASTSKAKDRKMKATVISGPVPLSGTDIILRMSASNRLIESSEEPYFLKAKRVVLPSKIKAFLFTVLHKGSGRVALQSKLTGKLVEVDVMSGRVAATGLTDRRSDKTEFFMEIGNHGYVNLVSPVEALGMACLVVNQGGSVVVAGQRGSEACQIFAAPKF
uniref:Pyrrolo-quinoline quinone repeat domain-containing protein n=1 Tax=Rhodosorus marinus TaxID=101924 RepID=A0A6T6MR36_9RHOD|mmetsp:Transcript_24264/g.34991  ORF Transcript_24264/g.34991 Transcript_24264/m.34991 type:complete len:637 (+) Transcript_24264:214-2124(+)|eukprot:CAMPEP_0184747860 /NCGR_PEP_ID=MMETSP0315-20130426/14201_1 /TAXON_ID=101924 /ORGANISM="Rhodosorus marinus, Strain UTEX LB 2760" /LENGTH=636 /DNA_ID=CAMNT_0027221869 /DNA_START=137 /DNA_END=2047 /DNA_ORIENTATION=-